MKQLDFGLSLIFVNLYLLDKEIAMIGSAEDTSLSLHIIKLLNEGQKGEQIAAELINKGHDETFINGLVRETGKLRYAKRRAQGLALILTGAVICLFSCIITIASATTGSLPTVLYGLTSVGILVIFAGLMKVF